MTSETQQCSSTSSRPASSWMGNRSTVLGGLQIAAPARGWMDKLPKIIHWLCENRNPISLVTMCIIKTMKKFLADHAPSEPPTASVASKACPRNL